MWLTQGTAIARYFPWTMLLWGGHNVVSAPGEHASVMLSYHAPTGRDPDRGLALVARRSLMNPSRSMRFAIQENVDVPVRT